MAHHLFSQMPHYHAQVGAGGDLAVTHVCNFDPPTHLTLARPRPRAAPLRSAASTPTQPTFIQPKLTSTPPAPPRPHPQEATAALKAVLGPYYCHDGRNVMAALWQETKSCHYVAPDAPGSGVLWYRSHCDAGKDA